jgi:hypothetical protein
MESPLENIKFDIGVPVSGILDYDKPYVDKYGNANYKFTDGRSFRASEKVHEAIQTLGIVKGGSVTLEKYSATNNNGNDYTAFRVNGMTYADIENGIQGTSGATTAPPPSVAPAPPPTNTHTSDATVDDDLETAIGHLESAHQILDILKTKIGLPF